MKRPLHILSFALMISAAPAAFAQTGTTASQGQLPAGDHAGYGDSATMEQFQLRSEVEENIRERMGPEQRPLELVQTTLLNRFGGLGFHRIVNIDKQDTNYVAMVETVRGNNIVLVIDPRTGQILSERPANAGEVASAGSGTSPAMTGTTAPGAGATGTMGTTGTTGRTLPQAADIGASQPDVMIPGTPEGGDVLADVGCNPVDWAPLEQRIGTLPQDRELAARRLMMEILDHYADEDRVQCRDKLEDLRSLVQTASAR